MLQLDAVCMQMQRGALVTVFEKSDHIGGSAELGTRTPDKEALKALVTYYEIQAQKQKIDMRFQTEATMEMIRECDPYAIFVGTGANPLIPTIDGIKDTKYMTIPEALDYDFKPEGKKIVVIGGGMTGSETAEHFAMMGNDVTLVEMQSKLAPEVSPDNLVTVIKHLKEYHAAILVSHKLTKLADGLVTVENMENGEKKELEADYIIMSLGNRPNRTLYGGSKRRI